jgi:hypothetical protein
MAADCPTEARWEAFAMGELSWADRTAIVGHATRCDLCGKTLQALTELHEGARVIDPGRRHQRAAWGVAGSLAAVAAALVWFLHPVARPPETLRSAPATAALAVETVDGAAVRWSAVPGAREYVVRLYRETGALVDTVRTTEPELRWALDPGSYRLEVEALDPTGVVARSRLTRFTAGR